MNAKTLKMSNTNLYVFFELVLGNIQILRCNSTNSCFSKRFADQSKIWNGELNLSIWQNAQISASRCYKLLLVKMISRPFILYYLTAFWLFDHFLRNHLKMRPALFNNDDFMGFNAS